MVAHAGAVALFSERRPWLLQRVTFEDTADVEAAR
jgi:hypothetical protein